MLLSDVDPQRYQEDIGLIVDGMLRRQRPNGCFSYEPYSYDDTSQTQYGLLCLWTAVQNGYQVPGDALERAANWVITTQYPDGGWSYRPTYEGEAQDRYDALSDHTFDDGSRSGNGLSSGSPFGMGTSTDVQTGLPPAHAARGRSRPKREAFPADAVNREAFQNTMRSADTWFARNLRFDVALWTHYYMYGFERYKSFQELVEGQMIKDPPWYRQGVDFLKRTQKPDGSWKCPQPATVGNAAIDTAFAVLFLTRTPRKLSKRRCSKGNCAAAEVCRKTFPTFGWRGADRQPAGRPGCGGHAEAAGRRGRRCGLGPLGVGQQTRFGSRPDKARPTAQRLRRLVDQQIPDPLEGR